VPTSPVPSAAASAIRCDSPPDSVAEARSKPAVDFVEHAARDRLLGALEPQLGQEAAHRSDRHLREVADRLAAEANAQRVGPQPRARAGRAPLVAAVALEERAHLHAVLAPLEPAEEAEHTRELVVALEHEPAVALVEEGPRHVERNPPPACEAPQLREQVPVVRLVPGLDGALGQALVLVRHDEVEVDLDQVPEAVAGGAGPERVIEREQARLRLEERSAALRALEVLRNPKGRPPRHDDHRPASPG
jgi:hypothetical protein